MHDASRISIPGGRRPPALRRCWLFLPGADARALTSGMACGADALIQELEDFTPPEQRAEARALAADLYVGWRTAGAVAAVRINPLEGEGRTDLEAVMRGRPDVVVMSKVAEPWQVQALDAEVTRLEQALAIPAGSTELVPNVESARGVLNAYAIGKASARVTGVLTAKGADWRFAGSGAVNDASLGAGYGLSRVTGPIELARGKTGYALKARLAEAKAWDRAALSGAMKATLASSGLKMPQLAMPLRVLVAGRAQTPSIDAVLELLGRETVLARLGHFLDTD